MVKKVNSELENLASDFVFFTDNFILTLYYTIYYIYKYFLYSDILVLSLVTDEMKRFWSTS